MNIYYKSKKIDRLGNFLEGKMKRSFLWRAIDAGQVSAVYKELTQELKELKGSQFVSWNNQILKIRVGSSAQRQAIILKLPDVMKVIKRRGVDIKELKILFR